MRNRPLILDIPFDNLTINEVVEEILNKVNHNSVECKPAYVATVNVDFLVNTFGWISSKIINPELFNALRNADLVTPDGMPILWLSKLLGCPLKERVTGADLIPELIRVASQSGKKVYFLGGREGVARKAAQKLRAKYPGIKIVGIASPMVSIENKLRSNKINIDQQIIEKINAARPDILLIGFGNPKQEIWFNRNKDRLNVPVSIGIGGTFEFIAGTVTRAPKWMQSSGLEWVFRVLQEPGRLWKRYFIGMAKFTSMAGVHLLKRLAIKKHSVSLTNIKTDKPVYGLSGNYKNNLDIQWIKKPS